MSGNGCGNGDVQTAKSSHEDDCVSACASIVTATSNTALIYHLVIIGGVEDRGNRPAGRAGIV